MDELREQAYFKMGMENEILFTPILREKFGNNLVKTKHYLSVLDFESPTHYVELKSRDYIFGSFSNWIIGYNKVIMGFEKIKQGKKVFFVFAFKQGGTYFWELTKENFDLIGGMNQVYMNGTDSRGYDDFKQHLHIPSNALTKLSDKCSYTFSIEPYKQDKLLGQRKCLLKI